MELKNTFHNTQTRLFHGNKRRNVIRVADLYQTKILCIYYLSLQRYT